MKRSLSLTLLFSAALAAVSLAQNATSIGTTEATKCEERISTAHRDVLQKYTDALGELQAVFQKTADLEGALAVRAERQRVAKEVALSERNYVREPKALLDLQKKTLAKMLEMSTAIIGETVPRLVEFKKQLTVAGKLDEAIEVRTAIERLQNAHLPLDKPEAGEVVAAEELAQAYAADRARADKQYRGNRFVVRGKVAGFRQDPQDNKAWLVFLTGAGQNNFVQCSFSAEELRIREDNSFGAPKLVISDRNGFSPVNVSAGVTLDIRGQCEGLEGAVRMGKCQPAR